MTFIQRLILITAAFILLGGIIATILSDDLDYRDLFILYLSIIVITIFLYNAFSQSHKAITKISKQKSFQHSDGSNLDTSDISNHTLLAIKTTWPFDFFPDTLIIHEKSISIIRKSFFMTHWSDTVQLNDIGSVIMNSGPFFGSLGIYLKLPNKEFTLNFLAKKQAFLAKELIDGLLLQKDSMIKMPDNISLNTKKKLLQVAANEKELEKEIDEM